MQARKVIQEIVFKGGPEPSEYQILNDAMGQYVRENVWDYTEVTELFGDAFSKYGFIREILLGNTTYHGNAFLIHALKTYIPHEQGYAWDNFIAWQPSSDALRSRVKWVAHSFPLIENAESLMDIGCGLGHALHDKYHRDRFWKSCIGVDADKDAISYAQVHHPGPDFLCYNILKKWTLPCVDMIYSEGLMDYFHDSLWVRVVNKLSHALTPNKSTRMVLGNFSDTNPSKEMMEMLGWKLHHRSREGLLSLARQVNGVRSAWVTAEPLGINLFLVMDFHHVA